MSDERDSDTGTSPGASAAGPPAGRRYPVAPVVLLALSAAALWGASRMTWVSVRSSDGLTEPRTDDLDGGTWFGALTPLALVLLAAIAAVLATKGWLRRVVGMLVALVGAVVAVPALALLTGSGATAQRAATLAELPARAQVEQVSTAAAPAVLTMAGALAAFAAGVLLARMPKDSAQLSGKYDTPVARRAAATDLVAGRGEAGDDTAPPVTERVLWDALDAGTDPTDDHPRTGTDDGPAEPGTR
ncbi:TIGR02234 family membrane protein [Nocardia cyriacigeorgica]|uniref:TIGR02234 family membrane protein n=1 Tax=Nocardia cyriacigeorgica TaxID=135487 RepID=A0A5R8PFP2_9NOCA|nr:TIGR02234 family membrane protein [Nocardia cyriacigeorgica]TLG13488.1 TIGR02234 family membrane protein [Nocardia cyriacigeorgica]